MIYSRMFGKTKTHRFSRNLSVSDCLCLGLYSTVYSTVHITVYSTVCSTVYSIVYSTIYSTVYSAVCSTAYSTVYSTEHLRFPVSAATCWLANSETGNRRFSVSACLALDFWLTQHESNSAPAKQEFPSLLDKNKKSAISCFQIRQPTSRRRNRKSQMFCTVYSTVYNTVNITVYSTAHITVYSTVYSTA